MTGDVEAVFRDDVTVSLDTLSVKLADTSAVRSVTTNRGTSFVGYSRRALKREKRVEKRSAIQVKNRDSRPQVIGSKLVLSI